MATIEINPLKLEDPDLAENTARRLVSNILNSYPHTTDVLAESIQNAVDEVSEADYPDGTRPEVAVRLNADTNVIEVIDNGRGIERDRIESLLAPNVSDKELLFNSGKVRGHKGVGLTFLAYGFNKFVLESKTTSGDHYRVTILNGRNWAMHVGPGVAPNLTQILDDSPSDFILATRGTLIQVFPDEKSSPKRVGSVFPSAALASAIIETQTAIGQVPFGHDTAELTKFDGYLEYTNSAGVAEDKIPLSTSYRFPHVNVNARILDRDEWKKLDRSAPAEDEKDQEAVWRWYEPDKIIDLLRDDASGEELFTRQEIADYIRAHDLNVYALCTYAALYKDRIADSWAVPRGRKLVQPGLRIATDRMISSWEPQLVKMDYRGYINRIWLLYHFRNVQPDLGRKNFPPQVHDVLANTEKQLATDLIRSAEAFLAPVPRGGGEDDDESANEDPLEISIRRRTEAPMTPSELPGIGALSFATVPDNEQDAIALFCELLGNGLLSCYRLDFLTTSGIYDGYIRYEVSKVNDLLASKLPGRTSLGGAASHGTVEFKFHGDKLIEDIVRKKKKWEKIHWLICWDLGSTARDFGDDRIAFAEAPDARSRTYAGVTHLAKSDRGGRHEIYVISLKDLLDKVK